MKILLILLFSFSAGAQTLVPEILSLKKNNSIERSTLENYSSMDIATSLVKRIAQKEHIKNTEPIYDFRKQARIVIAFNLRNVELIQKNCFLNQHQTGTSNAYLGPDRIKQENKMLALNLGTSKEEKEILPKYAYLFLDGAPASLETNSSLIDDYGGVYAEFKDEVKDRATFTPGDSLVIEAGPKDLRSFDYKLYKENQIKKYYTAYWEAQIWGKVCMEDVEKILIGCTVPFPDDQIERLKNVTDKPVYRCHKKMIGTRVYSVEAQGEPL